MPQLDTTLEGVAPWMTAPPLPKTTSFMEAFRMAQEQNSPQAMADLKLKQAQIQHLGFQMQNDQLLLQKNKFDMENALAGKQAETEVSSEMAKVQDWSDPASVARVLDTYSKRPTAQSRALVNEAVTMHKDAVTAKDKADQLDLRAQIAQSNRELGAAKIEKDWTVAASKAEVAAARLEAAQSKVSPQAAERDELVKLTRNQKALAALVKSNPGDPQLNAMLADANTALEGWHAQHKGGLTASLQYDDQGRPIINLGEGKATVGTQTSVQTELANIKNSVVQIDQAASALTEKDLGVAGNVWDNIVNRFVSQVAPEAGDPTVSANRAQLQKAVDSYLQSQQARGRLSAAERQEVRNTLVTQHLGESLPRAKAVLATMARIQKFEAISRAKTGQQPLQAWMFNGLSQTEIGQLRKEGIITPDESIEWGLKATRR